MTNADHLSAPPALDSLAPTHGPKPPGMEWEATAARKRDDRANRLKPYAHWSLGELSPPPSHKNVTHLVHARLTDRERSFLAFDVTDLCRRLATKECKAVEVTTAFCKATYAAQELTNCVTEVMFAQALARAQELDDHMSETGHVVGPLHGVPVSIKDHICVKGEDTATGFVGWAGRTVAKEDAAIVQILRASGAVIYVKTTNPQSLFAFETFSNIYGCTVNPYNRDLTPGGSSGGEGALIASRGSLLGVGTDIGGSIGMENIVGVIGPMAHSARDLDLFFKVVSKYEPWIIDFSTICMPWKPLSEDGGNQKLVIGVFVDDGVVAPHPPIVERLEKTRGALVAAGHEVIDWIPMDHLEAFELTAKLYMLDGGDDIYAALAESGEPAIPHVARILPDPKQGGGSTLAQSWATNVQRDQFRARVLKHWNDTALRTKSGQPVDAILCPAAPTLAPPHGTTRWIGYTSYWNLVDLPAVVFPSGKPFDAGTWKSTNSAFLNEARNPIDEFVKGQWNPDTFQGAPVGLQLVGRRWQEEKLLDILMQVENSVTQL